jgi:hypothetical protein
MFMYHVRTPAQPALLGKSRLQRLTYSRAESDRPTFNGEPKEGTTSSDGNASSQAKVISSTLFCCFGCTESLL